MSQLSYQKVLAFVPMHNSKGKKDVTGAFLPEAQRFVKLADRGSRIERFDNSKNLIKRRDEVLSKMKKAKSDGFTSLSFFCHGWMNGMQAGFLKNHVVLFAEAIDGLLRNDDEDEDSTTTQPIIALYCCSTGDDPQDDPLSAVGTGDDSFADKLRDALCAHRPYCRVVGHTTVAHTTKNPMVIFMDGMGVPAGGVGGYPPVSPKASNWKRWVRALRTTDLRLRMPYMTPADIHKELSV